MNHKSMGFGRLVVGIAALSVLLTCASPEKGVGPESTANVSVPETTPVEVKKATGTVTGMALTYPANQEQVELRIVYRVKLDDGTEVSAQPPARDQSPTSIGSVKSDDKGKRVELESLSGDEAKTALAAWKIVRVLD